jgi:maltooligosyltrehalose trehalohydrolase
MGLRILSGDCGGPEMALADNGFWEIMVEGVSPGARYVFVLDGLTERPDPASCFQPDGVTGPSEVTDHAAYGWGDARWGGVQLGSLILYELHVGTFTREGTFDAVIPRLRELKRLGINAVQLMPIAQFPGGRNWGYDGSFPYAVQNSYGGPRGLKNLVNEAHKSGIAVFLDVVYNHIGPEGNRLDEFGPYFSSRHNGIWGHALNFDEAGSDKVRDYFIENDLSWFRDYHIDGLRLDAVDAIFDQSARPFLEELAARTAALAKQTGRRLTLTAESDRNDPRMIRPPDLGGYGIDAQWCDDFHHSLHALLTGEKRGYYADFGSPDQMVGSIRQGYVYQGEYSTFRGRRHGAPPTGCKPDQFIVFSQNHDQVGNRLGGTRLAEIISFEAAKLAAACVLVSPFVPMLFMGEEYGETSPFLFFADHASERLREAVRDGRKKTIEALGWNETPEDPCDPATFLKSKIAWDNRTSGRHAVMLAYYENLLGLRSGLPALARPGGLADAGRLEDSQAVFLRRSQRASDVFAILNFSGSPVQASLPLGEGRWGKRLDSSDARWEGPGSVLQDEIEDGHRAVLNPHSAVILEKTARRRR